MADPTIRDGEPVVDRADIAYRPEVQRCKIEWDTLRRSFVTDVHSQGTMPSPPGQSVGTHRSEDGIHGDSLWTSGHRLEDGI
jgi:hypothetical protein